jgi:hypothetical protein
MINLIDNIGIVRQPVFIAGPYAADPYTAEVADTTWRNVSRALALGHLAATLGYAPIVPHAQGWLAVYGGNDDTGAPSLTRSRALHCSTALASGVGRLGGAFWLIAQGKTRGRSGDFPGSMTDAVLSPGCHAEWAAFSAHGVSVNWGTWDEWVAARPFALPQLEQEFLIRLTNFVRLSDNVKS